MESTEIFEVHDKDIKIFVNVLVKENKKTFRAALKINESITKQLGAFGIKSQLYKNGKSLVENDTC
jgi:hypothetical protein